MRLGKLERLLLSAILTLTLVSCSVTSKTAATGFAQPLPGYSHKGILEDVMIPSSEPYLKERRAIVYLPSDYYESDKRYPVLYLLHGARGSELSWIDEGSVLQRVDSLESNGLCRKFILVLPNMNNYKSVADYGYANRKGALSSFFGVNGAVETVFVKDVVRTIDSLYRTVPVKKSRAIAGVSIGGMQSIYISAHNPDKFGAIGLFSPMAHSFIEKSKYSSFYDNLDAMMEKQFANPPADYWIMLGTDDFYYGHMKNWHRKLLEKGYPHTLYITDGGHTWKNWSQYIATFISSCKALGAP